MIRISDDISLEGISMDFSDFNKTNEKVILSRGMARQCPVNGSLELLPLCNMNCEMCYIRRSKAEVDAGGGLHDVEEWIRLGEEMARAGVLFLLLTGGEPLLFPDFQKLYLSLKKQGMILTVNTNGTLLDEGWADFFAAHRPRRINITLYGGSDTAYEKLCHYQGGFSGAVEAIRLLRERNVDVKINESVTRYNREDMEAIYRIGKELNVPVHMDTYMLPGLRERDLPFAEQSRLLPEEAAAAEVCMRRHEMEEQEFQMYVRNILWQISQEEVPYPGQITCLAGNCSFAVGWKGEMRPCVTFDAPSVPVFEQGFEYAWKEISSRSKELSLNHTCKECPLRPVCKVCPATAMLETGRYDGVPEYLCRYTRELVRLLQKFMVQEEKEVWKWTM